MILIAGTVRIPEGALDKARPAMKKMLDASRAEPGCIRYAYAQDVIDPGLIHVSESWKNREALASHFETGHMAEWRSNFAALGITDRDLKLHEADEGVAV